LTTNILKSKIRNENNYIFKKRKKEKRCTKFLAFQRYQYKHSKFFVRLSLYKLKLNKNDAPSVLASQTLQCPKVLTFSWNNVKCRITVFISVSWNCSHYGTKSFYISCYFMKILLPFGTACIIYTYCTLGTSHFAYGHFAYVAFCLQKICRQNDTLFRILCHMAYGHFAYRNRLDATKLCVKLPISVGQMRQNRFQHLSHSAYKMDWKIRIYLTLG
jgi:hypothetical protein